MTCQSCGYHGEVAVCKLCRLREAAEDKLREHPLPAEEAVAIIKQHLKEWALFAAGVMVMVAGLMR